MSNPNHANDLQCMESNHALSKPRTLASIINPTPPSDIDFDSLSVLNKRGNTVVVKILEAIYQKRLEQFQTHLHAHSVSNL